MQTLKVALFMLLSIVGNMMTNGEEFSKETYCNMNAGHTMCIYEKGVLGPACDGAVPYVVTQDDRTDLINAINAVRSKVALGNSPVGESGYQLPSAANMNALAWDDELAAMAERWAYQCTYGHDPVHWTVNDRLSTGQNGFQGGASKDGSWRPDLTEVVNAWYSEYNAVTKLRFDTGTDPSISWERQGHVREVVYGATTHIGCGLMRYTKNDSLKNWLVCNFGGKSNPGGAFYYIQGDPASQCQINYTGNSTTGLCVSSDALPSTKTMKPTDPPTEAPQLIY